MRDIDARDQLVDATFEFRVPAQAQALAQELFQGSYPQFKEIQRASATLCVHRGDVGWGYESTKDYAAEDGESIPIDERLLISDSDIERYRSAADVWHSVLSMWRIPHSVEIENPLAVPAQESRGLALDESDKGPSARAWDSKEALDADGLQRAIDEASSLAELRELVADAERASSSQRTLEQSAALLPPGAFAAIEPAFRAFSELRRAHDSRHQRYGSKATALQIVAMAESCPPETWKDALGEPVLNAVWRSVRSALWTDAFDELAPATQWAILKAEAETCFHFSPDDYCLWAERAQLMAKNHAGLLEADPVSKPAGARVLRMAIKPSSPEQEQRVLMATLSLDRVLNHPLDAPAPAAKAAMRL